MKKQAYELGKEWAEWKGNPSIDEWATYSLIKKSNNPTANFLTWYHLFKEPKGEFNDEKTKIFIEIGNNKELQKELLKGAKDYENKLRVVD